MLLVDFVQLSLLLLLAFYNNLTAYQLVVSLYAKFSFFIILFSERCNYSLVIPLFIPSPYPIVWIVGGEDTG